MSTKIDRYIHNSFLDNIDEENIFQDNIFNLNVFRNTIKPPLGKGTIFTCQTAC